MCVYIYIYTHIHTHTFLTNNFQGLPADARLAPGSGRPNTSVLGRETCRAVKGVSKL